MRLADTVLFVALLALLLIVTFAFKPRSPTTPTPRKVFEPFVGYQVYGGGGGVWAPPNGVGGSPQCTDKAIGFQEDTQDPGRHWGWENNATCAFYSIPKATNVAPGRPVAQPAQGGGSCYGARADANCNSCADVINAYKALNWKYNIKDFAQCQGVPESSNPSVDALFEAAKNGELDVVRNLIEDKGVPANTTRSDGTTFLHSAANGGNLEVVKYLIEDKGVPPNTARSDGYSVLHSAAKSGNLELVRYLIEDKGVPATTALPDGYSVLHEAADIGNLEMVNYLIEEKGIPATTARRDDAYSVLHIAANSGNLDVVRYLLKKGAPATATTTYGESVLHYAAWTGKMELVRYLVETIGLRDLVRKKNNGNKTPIDIAKEQNHQAIVDYLQSIGGGRQAGMYEQCGGKGGSCAKDGQCADSAWQGVSCPPNASCTKVNEWHWQCDSA